MNTNKVLRRITLSYTVAHNTEILSSIARMDKKDKIAEVAGLKAGTLIWVNTSLGNEMVRFISNKVGKCATTPDRYNTINFTRLDGEEDTTSTFSFSRVANKEECREIAESLKKAAEFFCIA